MSEEYMMRLEEESRAQTLRVKTILIEDGRQDLADELDRNLRDIRLGLSRARAVWSAISPAQRKVLMLLHEGRHLARAPASRTRYGMRGEAGAIQDVCGLPTVRAMTARDLLDCDGTLLDPEARLRLSEHGRFVLDYGRVLDTPACDDPGLVL